MTGVLAVRVKHGLVGESRRTVHVVPVADDAPVVDTLTTVCGTTFEADQVDVVPTGVGMPCTTCVARLATDGVLTMVEQ